MFLSARKVISHDFEEVQVDAVCRLDDPALVPPSLLLQKPCRQCSVCASPWQYCFPHAFRQPLMKSLGPLCDAGATGPGNHGPVPPTIVARGVMDVALSGHMHVATAGAM